MSAPTSWPVPTRSQRTTVLLTIALVALLSPLRPADAQTSIVAPAYANDEMITQNGCTHAILDPRTDREDSQLASSWAQASVTVDGQAVDHRVLVTTRDSEPLVRLEVPGLQPDSSHTIRVSTPAGSTAQAVATPSSCRGAPQLTATLAADGATGTIDADIPEDVATLLTTQPVGGGPNAPALVFSSNLAAEPRAVAAPPGDPVEWTVRVVDPEGYLGGASSVTLERQVGPERSIDRIAGDDRFATASQIAAAAADDTGGTVIVASGLDFPDALAAANIGVPVLLTAPDVLVPPAAAALAEAQPSRVIVAGGPSAISSEVGQAIAEVVGDADIERIAGDGRYDTANALVTEAHGSDAPGIIMLASGAEFPDALAAGALAATGDAALVLTDPAVLVEGTVDALESLAADGAERLVVVGGTAAVSDAVADAAAEVVGASVERVEGPTRTDTADAVAAFATGEGIAGTDAAVLARADDFADALVAAPLAASLGAPLVLEPSTTTTDCERSVTITGGEAAVSAAVADQLAAQCSGLDPDQASDLLSGNVFNLRIGEAAAAAFDTRADAGTVRALVGAEELSTTPVRADGDTPLSGLTSVIGDVWLSTVEGSVEGELGDTPLRLVLGMGETPGPGECPAGGHQLEFAADEPFDFGELAERAEPCPS